MESSDENFYHSFPRIRPDDSQDHIIKVGLEILKAIRQIGLILSPEIVVWKQSLENGKYRTIIVRQSRLSFTELSRHQVEEHGKKFGPFALEFSINSLRRLGALPVIYMPQHLKDDRKFSTVGETVVAELADIKYTINQLQQLSLLTNPEHLLKSIPGATSVADECVMNLHNIDSSDNVAQSYQVPLKNLKDMLSYIGYRNAPFELMVGVINLVQSLFYPTDDNIHDSLLEYYRQREWRLVAGLALQGKSQTRSLTNSEKNTLLDIDSKFWSKQLSDGTVSFRRADDALVIETFDGKHVSEIISTVIVPPEAFDDAKLVFGDKVMLVGGT
jgi:hypothetical protein